MKLSRDLPITEAQAMLVSAGHSRAPVVHSPQPRRVVGVVHLRDLLSGHPSLMEAMRPALQLP